MHRVICLAVGLFLAGSLVLRGGDVEGLQLVPFPKEVQLSDGRFLLEHRLVLEISIPEGAQFAELLDLELKRAGVDGVLVRELKSSSPAFRIAGAEGALALPALPKAESTEAYGLVVRTNEIVCTAREAAGLFYGLQTVCQLIRANREGNGVPCVAVQDWPSLRWRAFQDDMTRGPSSTLEFLKHETSLGSYLKLNLMSYYMEYQYAFQKHPEIGPTNGSLSAGELATLVKHGRSLHMDILGSQQSFGHFGQILKHPKYAALRENGDVLTPVREETYQLLDDMYSEVCPVLPFPWFNICCDETEGLGTGPSRELAQKIGTGAVYVQHIRQLHELLESRYHKRMMMWGDIILQHPNELNGIPKDTIMLTWAYDARASFEDQIVPFAKSGFEFFVCPGVSDWSRVLPDFGVSVTNIRNFVRDGVKHGAIGMIDTDWVDDGEAIKAVKWYADAWAAECAWNGSVTPIDQFNRRIGAVLFGEAGDEFGQAVQLLGQTHRLPGMSGMLNARFWENDFIPRGPSGAVQSTASNLLAVVRPAIQHLEACRQSAHCEPHLLNAYLFGARRMELIGQRMLDGLEAVRLYQGVSDGSGGVETLDRITGLLRKNRESMETLCRQFTEFWTVESKPFALDWTQGRYANAVKQYDALLPKISSARAALAAGQPVPAPDEIGFEEFRPTFRGAQPHEVLASPIAGELPWAEGSATHRLGLVVRAGSADRFDLPVEVELRLPEEAVGKPVRAFRLNTNGEPQEMLAQVDRLSKRGRARLTVILPGLLRQGTEATVQVYLGLSHKPASPAEAVSTKLEDDGKAWIENAKVRLLLGAEGAHIYRWELKALQNRDLTVPGESGWTGFCDEMAHRSDMYRLECTAQGPAMVEYQCVNRGGQVKTIRLYGGMSWIEVKLNEPAPDFWNYDDPKNFAADGPDPGEWLFSNGKHGAVGRHSDGVSAQVKMPEVYWGIKFNQKNLALGMITPEWLSRCLIGPGHGEGGVGIEGSPAAGHFVVYGGVLNGTPEETMSRLQRGLNLNQLVDVRAGAVQAK